MKQRIKRPLSIFGVAVVSISLMLVLASLKAPPKRKSATDNRPTISVMQVKNNPIQLTIPVIGRLNAQQKVDLLAEVSGVLQSSGKEFLEGQTYQAGDVMLRINQEETELNLKAQRSMLLTAIAALLPELKFDYLESYQRWNAYLKDFDLETTTRPLPATANEREKFFVASKGIYNSYYTIKSQEARLEKYKIRAPFNGVLIQSNITPGNLVRSGQVLGVLIRPDHFDLETSVSISASSHIRIGDKARLTSDQLEGQWMGTVTRINQSIDEHSQMIQVYISVSAPELREKMFLKGEIKSSDTIIGIELPRKMLQGGDTVLEVVDSAIHFRKVNVVATRGETALVEGLPEGMVISTKTMNLHDGSLVKLPGTVESPQKAKAQQG